MGIQNSNSNNKLHFPVGMRYNTNDRHYYLIQLLFILHLNAQIIYYYNDMHI